MKGGFYKPDFSKNIGETNFTYLCCKYFNQFKKELKKKDSDRIVRALYRWIDQMKLKEPSLRYFIKTYGNKELIEEIKWFEQQINSNKKATLSLNIKAWSIARSNYLKNQINTVNKQSAMWINP